MSAIEKLKEALSDITIELGAPVPLVIKPWPDPLVFQVLLELIERVEKLEQKEV